MTAASPSRARRAADCRSRSQAICREAGIALCGPNCMGVLSPHHRSTTYLGELRDPAGLAGNVGLVSQSGAVCISLLTDVRRFGFSHVVSSGNEAVLVAADYLEYLVEDPHTAVIGAFIETIRQPERFVAALDRAAASDKPVVVLKVGPERTRAACRPTHTGGEAGEPASVSALLRAHRAIEVADLGRDDRGAGRLPERPPPGRAAHRGHHLVGRAGRADPRHRRSGRPLAATAVEAARAEIVARIGPITGDGNPLDAWGSGTFTANLPHALRLFDASPDHDIVVFCRDNGDDAAVREPGLVQTYLDLFAQAAAASRKPHYLLHTRPGIMDRQLVRNCAHGGSPWSAACARGCRRSTGWRGSPAGQIHDREEVRRDRTRGVVRGR